MLANIPDCRLHANLPKRTEGAATKKKPKIAEDTDGQAFLALVATKQE